MVGSCTSAGHDGCVGGVTIGVRLSHRDRGFFSDRGGTVTPWLALSDVRVGCRADDVRHPGEICWTYPPGVSVLWVRLLEIGAPEAVRGLKHHEAPVPVELVAVGLHHEKSSKNPVVC